MHDALAPFEAHSPDAPEGVSLPTVAEIVELAEVQEGKPELFSSPAALTAQVRWAHVVAGLSAPGLLDGQECALTTGEGWPGGGSALTSLIEALCDAGISALVLELGDRFHATPKEVVEVCGARDITLIVLHRKVKFVQLTQRIHRRILGAQNEALQARERVHRVFTELGLNRSPVDFMVEEMAATLGAPVVLENTAGQVVAWSSPETGASPHEVLEPWLRGMFVAPAQPPEPGDEPLDRVSVEAQGTKWGTLTALPGPQHPAGRHTVLELGAITLALSRLADDGDEWLQLSAKQLIDTLLEGRYRTDTDAKTQLIAGGLPFDSRTLFGLALSGAGDFGSHVTLERAVLETALRRAIAPEGRAIITDDPRPGTHGVSLVALVSLPSTDPRATVGAPAHDAPQLAVRINRELEMLVPSPTPAAWRAHLSIGTRTGGSGDAAKVRGLLTSLEGVLQAGVLAPSSSVGRVTVQEAERQPLSYLLRNFSGSPALQHFVEETLGPVLEHDLAEGRGHQGDLFQVLQATLAHPTNRSHAASQAGLSRSVFYQRLQLIEELLSVDLSDGETIATLTVAAMAASMHSM